MTIVKERANFDPTLYGRYAIVEFGGIEYLVSTENGHDGYATKLFKNNDADCCIEVLLVESYADQKEASQGHSKVLSMPDDEFNKLVSNFSKEP